MISQKIIEHSASHIYLKSDGVTWINYEVHWFPNETCKKLANCTGKGVPFTTPDTLNPRHLKPQTHQTPDTPNLRHIKPQTKNIGLSTTPQIKMPFL